ncbi:MAG TPA: DUF3137 domain-containing protein [Demequinaceae bacterium]
MSPRSVISAAVGALSVVAILLLNTGIVAIAGPWVMAAIVGLLVVAVGWFAWDLWSQGRHRRAMMRFADHIDGWEYRPQTRDYDERFLTFPFGVGRDLRDVDLIRGPFNGFACASFTHEYEEGDKDEFNATSRWQIDVVDLPYPLAKVDIVPDDFLAKFAKLLGGQDIDFESAQFNARWRVKAGDAKYAHDIVHPRLMERLLEADADGLAIRIEGSAVYSWAVDRRGPEDLARRLGVLTAVARSIPDFVYREFKEVHDRLAEEQRKREENAPEWAKTPFALSGGRYTDLGREDYREMELSRFGDQGGKPPSDGGPGGGAGHWDAPPDDPNRVRRG